jgi:L-ascorbate metabolism protein UlaG (beta-lactamase superfamily)
VDAIGLTYVGHACVLIETGGLRLLTDPVLRGRIGPLRRVAPPPVPAATEGIDVVLVSHAHLDHLDVPSLRRLAGSPAALCPPAATGAVRRGGLEPAALRPGEGWRRGAIEVVATAADHDGRRWPTSRDGGAIGFTVRGPGGTVYFAGDTAEFGGMAAIGPVDVALLPVAGWGPRLPPGHLDPAGAARVAAAVRARVAVPIHWGTFARRLMRNGEPDAPAREFAERVAEEAPACEVRILAPGESTVVSPGGGA